MNDRNDFDVVVIGGGPHGFTYASWLKKWDPRLRVAVVEKRSATGYKIGESLLSTATRSFIASGLSMPMMRRLFGNKAGIRFWWTDQDSNELHRHIDVVDIEETFQVERRVLEIAMQEAGVRVGIELFTGTRVNVSASNFEGPFKRIRCEGPTGVFDLTARVVCDASGPASVLPRHFKYYRKAPELNQTFNTNSYYAYFRQKRDLPVAHWKEPATRHICFPGGWMWFINLVSWEKTPEENLRAMVRHLLDHDGRSDEAFGSRRALADKYGCATDTIVSIGFVIRDDMDDTAGLSVRERFAYHAAKHPATAGVMDHYEMLDSPYGQSSPVGVFSNLVHDATQYAGDGWCVVGDAAAFTNPIFSPGLNIGSGSCYLAARATLEALKQGDVSRQAFHGYERYMKAIYSAVLNETDMYYRGFNHVDSYEWVLLLKLFFGAADVIVRDSVYSNADPFVHDLLNPVFRSRVDAVRAIMRNGEENGISAGEVAADVRNVIEPFVRELLSWPDVRDLHLEEVFTEYDADGRRVEDKHRHRPSFGFEQCTTCDSFVDRSLTACPVCGEATAEGRSRRHAA